ncbi:unnamed protein product, partial [Dibothriocephalus latus]
KSTEVEVTEQEAEGTDSQEERQPPSKVDTEQAPSNGPPNFDFQSARSREIHSFLRGSTCLSGGLGWWKHEVCYGRKIIQYHESMGSAFADVFRAILSDRRFRRCPLCAPQCDGARMVSYAMISFKLLHLPHSPPAVRQQKNGGDDMDPSSHGLGFHVTDSIINHLTPAYI